ncbi:MAG: UDP-N-acetylglucosamine--N-acetylmuramyl-(pentapeptide) pyrophosphoryl-undecaprenol N-acetylglucosamine transferase [Candidatus Omnitrophota bacterium]|jgi:UDP-N-acetylglucosamine--N-acetylmuramyl-(pentapeptide) pyrophosphoryl-undecaprenol N-acetylglucosamine transferase
MRILFVCDRSGGHVFPALAIAGKIKQNKQNSEIHFFITSAFLKEHLSQKGFTVWGKSFNSRNLFVEMFYRIFEAGYLIFRLRPKMVIGFGGRDSFFLMLFASLLNLDTAIYEPNVKPGKANSFLSLFVKKVFRGFKEEKTNKKTIVIGIPLRENIKKIERAAALAKLGFRDKPTLFCFGGSQGSVFLNDVFLKLIQSLDYDFQVIHLTGQSEYFKISQFYNKIEKKSFVKDFYYEMETLYSASDVVLARSGASTLAEIAYYKLPSILIPHPAAGGHQKENALYLVNKEAAYMYYQENFSFDDFKRTVQSLLEDRRLRQRIEDNLSAIKIGISFEDFSKNTYF